MYNPEAALKNKMRIYGLDFTSAPSSGLSSAKNRKRLILAVCTLENDILEIENLEELNGAYPGDFSGFEKWLCTEGEWFAGLDFPFGQPARLIRDLNWPGAWPEYVRHIQLMGKSGFESTLESYKFIKPKGQKELLRITDRKAGAVSPMKLYGVPVGKMFFQGATRLNQASLSIHPVRVIESETRHVIEAYPKLVARTCVGSQPYKRDTPKTDDDPTTRQRQEIVNAICAPGKDGTDFQKTYSIRVTMAPELKTACVRDHTGDRLDSVLCAVQAAWCWRMREKNYGVPADADSTEGWICDPQMFSGQG